MPLMVVVEKRNNIVRKGNCSVYTGMEIITIVFFNVMIMLSQYVYFCYNQRFMTWGGPWGK